MNNFVIITCGIIFSLVAIIVVDYDHDYFQICTSIATCHGIKEYTILVSDKNEIQPGYDKRTRPSHDVNYVPVLYNNGVSTRYPRLVKTSILKTKCQYVGIVFPYLDCGNASVGVFDGIMLTAPTNATLPTTDVIKAAIVKEWNNTSLRNRYTFYLAKEYERKSDYKNAIKYYTERVLGDGWVHERFYAQYRIAMCMMATNSSEISDIKPELVNAYALDPIRKEPLYHLARISRVEENYVMCLLYAGAAMQTGLPWDDSLFVDNRIYRWLVTEEYALCLYSVGRMDDARYYWSEMLKSDPPPDITHRITENLKF